MLVYHHAYKAGRSRRSRLLWAIGSLCLFPLVPIAYLVMRKHDPPGDLPGNDDNLDSAKN